MKNLSINELETIQGGSVSCSTGGTRAVSVGCGVGIGLIYLTGGLGALVFGPSTVALCTAMVLC